MKKVKIIGLVALVLFAMSCTRKKNEVSSVVEASWPTITLTGSQYYSIPVGGTLPTVSATAYDSLLKESYSTELDASGLDNSTPGLYIVPVKAKNKNGYISSKSVLIAVTDIDTSANLSGEYVRTATGVSLMVNKLANGLYETDNLFGAGTTAETYAYFAQIDDSTIVIPDQETNAGFLSVSDVFLTQLPGDTSYGYKIVSNMTSNRTLRIFQKQ
ncbi:MAG: hypothetical protein HWD58_07910 [Bacteroidota bacterium]|nr:hypothetical protein [Chitinophagaceae bacterium]QLH45530.1 MAG: hypothetical protein HWD58_07910 [Bacteroidota bacterium]